MGEITEKAVVGLLLAFGLSVALFIKSAFTAGLMILYFVSWVLLRLFFKGANHDNLDMPEVNHDLWDFINKEKEP